jgi:hypothetical protein
MRGSPGSIFRSLSNAIEQPIDRSVDHPIGR